jgi:hypothetical protein
MEELLSVYKQLRPYKWKDEGRGATDRLKLRMEDAPYVVNVIDGSVTALDHSRAMSYLYEGDESLVIHTSDRESRISVIEQIRRDELASTGVQLELSNARKDTHHVTLAEAIRHFNSFQGVGVDINKVSVNGNSRGFYRVEILKQIAKGCGLSTRSDAGKGDYSEVIQLFYTTYEKEIAEDKERHRVQITLEEELDAGTDIAGSYVSPNE